MKTEVRLADEALKRSQQEMRSLASYLQSVRERERSDIAREMHDVLGQSLTSLKLDLAWIARKLSAAEVASVNERLSTATRLLEETIREVKTLSTTLRPRVLDKFGLPAAVEWQCQEFEDRSGVKCRVQLPTNELVHEQSTSLFRILQEALTNVSRHAEANCVDVPLEVHDTSVTLVVRDDGLGIGRQAVEAPDSLGLLGMSERAESLGGSLKIERQPPRGTLVLVRIPLNTTSSKTHDQASNS